MILAVLAAGVPVAPGRDTGQAWAREELAKPAYARARPSLFLRVVQWLLDRLDQVAARTGLGAGQLVAVLLVAAVVVVAAVVLLRRQVRLSVATAGPQGGVLGASARTGAEHRELAARARAEGRYADAVRESMRAVARRLDERGLLDPRAGTHGGRAGARGDPSPAPAGRSARGGRADVRRRGLRPAPGQRRRGRAAAPPGPGRRGRPARGPADAQRCPVTAVLDADAPEAAAGSHPAGRDQGRDHGRRELVRRWGWPVAIATAFVLAVLVTVVANGRGNDVPLDPDGVGPDGSKALAEVLRAHGVSVQVVRSDAALAGVVDARPTATVLVSRTDLLGPADVRTLQEHVTGPGRSLVLVAPSTPGVAVLAPGVRLAEAHERVTRSAGCADPTAVRAGRADAGGLTYDVSAGAGTGCYPVGGHSSYVVLGSSPRVVVVGQPGLLTNDRLAHQGNASLMAGTLGGSGYVVWFVPPGAVAGQGQQSLPSVLPGWVGWVTLQLLVVVLVCMLWRGRRLGRLVPEPLPVAVRAVETTEGRARMYRRGRAHARAAAQLREAELARLRERTGLPRSASAADVAAVVAQRTGIPGTELLALLTGPPPTDDAGLVSLARTLDQLDREVRRP